MQMVWENLVLMYVIGAEYHALEERRLAFYICMKARSIKGNKLDNWTVDYFSYSLEGYLMLLSGHVHLIFFQRSYGNKKLCLLWYWLRPKIY